ncbi:cupin domain-containing protein [Anaerocolumna sedimenticola]|uniref:Cupin domain-containing protein n=1 Tax=Anaerocolumna sedimenticola TaxID=2696063 RepID=A0A6P1TMW0_9FIRM|nr:cupin domain-containing protein [Anaerocolumna sedimenticola]QHQ62550.1 cupin domain-containing protein [Anaerocolumna sedimenticola]
MSTKILKNIEMSTVMNLKDLVDYQTGQIVSKTLIQNKNVSLTLFAFDKGEEISTHSSHGDAMITVTEGTGEITIGENKYTLTEGQSIVMPAEIPHAVYASEAFKMFLIVVF